MRMLRYFGPIGHPRPGTRIDAPGLIAAGSHGRRKIEATQANDRRPG